MGHCYRKFVGFCPLEWFQKVEGMACMWEANVNNFGLRNSGTAFAAAVAGVGCTLC